MKKVKMIVVSYMPGLTQEPKLLVEPTEESVKEFIDSVYDGSKDSTAQACIWLRADNPFPCLFDKDKHSVKTE